MGLSYPTPPSIPLWRAALHRPGRFAGTFPRIEARADRLPAVTERYRSVCGFADPSPVTWPAIAARGLHLAIFTDAAFPVPVLGLVHVRQQIRWRRPLAPDEALSAECWVDGLRVVRSGGEFDLHTGAYVGGEEVWTAVATIFSRALPGDGQKRPRAQEEPFDATRSTSWRVPADIGRRYAAASGDYNPIHLFPATARPFGFRRAIAHGWWLLARSLAELDHEVPPVGELDVRFWSPVFLPGQAVFRAGPAGGGTRFELVGRETHLSGVVRPC